MEQKKQLKGLSKLLSLTDALLIRVLIYYIKSFLTIFQSVDILFYKLEDINQFVSSNLKTSVKL